MCLSGSEELTGPLICFSSDGETEHVKRQTSLSRLKQRLTELQSRSSQLNQDIKNKHQALYSGKEELDKLRYGC